MKHLTLKSFLIIGFAIATLSSCTTTNRTMREPNTRLNLTKSDFTLSDQVSASATVTKILGVDWSRLFTKTSGAVEGGAAGISLANIPVIGNVITDKTAGYALYELMKSNPGYDVVFYPQYETVVSKPYLGLGFLTKKTTVKTTARLGKMNK